MQLSCFRKVFPDIQRSEEVRGDGPLHRGRIRGPKLPFRTAWLGLTTVKVLN